MICYIVPAYNAKKTIWDCLESIFKQKGKKKVIVVDDCSTDKTVDTILKFSENNDKFFDLILHQSNKGSGASRNSGLMWAKGKYVAFIDSDVSLPEDWSEKALKALKNEDVAGVNGPGISPNNDSIIARSINAMLYGKNMTDEAKVTDSIATMDALYKFKAIKGLRFKEGVISGEDLLFNKQVRDRGYKLLYDTRLWVWHMHPENLISLTKKWRKYGRHFFPTYETDKSLMSGSIKARFLYFPLLLESFLIGFIWDIFHLMATGMILGLFLLYCYKSSKLKNDIKLSIAFPFIHTYKQLVQTVSIWV